MPAIAEPLNTHNTEAAAGERGGKSTCSKKKMAARVWAWKKCWKCSQKGITLVLKSINKHRSEIVVGED